ncbi:MAG TPA: paraquat-inducible protein A [Opitutus sp.]|nr:paraquat-inducible protein A [Opitutus sp.]
MKSPPPTLTSCHDGATVDGRFICRWCGCEHRPIPLAPRERALCSRCGATLAKGARGGLDTPLALVVAGLVLAVPSILLPLVTASKLGNERDALLDTGVGALWGHGYHALAVWVCVCGTIAPLLLLGTLAVVLLPARLGRPLAPRVLSALAHQLARWAMPEVYVLAVLVAFAKLGSVVTLEPGRGLWCYAAMTILIVAAWRSFDLEIAAPIRRHGARLP